MGATTLFGPICFIGFVILVKGLPGSAPENGPRYVFSGATKTLGGKTTGGVRFSAIRVNDNNQRFTIRQGKTFPLPSKATWSRVPAPPPRRNALPPPPNRNALLPPPNRNLSPPKMNIPAPPVNRPLPGGPPVRLPLTVNPPRASPAGPLPINRAAPPKAINIAAQPTFGKPPLPAPAAPASRMPLVPINDVKTDEKNGAGRKTPISGNDVKTDEKNGAGAKPLRPRNIPMAVPKPLTNAAPRPNPTPAVARVMKMSQTLPAAAAKATVRLAQFKTAGRQPVVSALRRQGSSATIKMNASKMTRNRANKVEGNNLVMNSMSFNSGPPTKTISQRAPAGTVQSAAVYSGPARGTTFPVKQLNSRNIPSGLPSGASAVPGQGVPPTLQGNSLVGKPSSTAPAVGRRVHALSGPVFSAKESRSFAFSAKAGPSGSPVPVRQIGGKPLPVPAGGMPAPVPAGGMPAPVPAGGMPAPVPAGGMPLPVPANSKPAPVPAAGMPAPAAANGKPVPVPTGGKPAPVQAGNMPATVPAGGVPAPVPAGGIPAPVPAGGVPAPVPASSKQAPPPARGKPVPVQSGGKPVPAAVMKPVSANDKKTDEKNGASKQIPIPGNDVKTDEKNGADRKTPVPGNDVKTDEKNGAVAAKNKPCVWSPICGTDRNTYPSTCVLPKGVTKECDGYCPCSQNRPGCGCPESYNPVCGIDDQTYNNECELFCAQTIMDCIGPCPCPRAPPPPQPTITTTLIPLSVCACPEFYQPVCGVDGQIYDNECLRQCEGVAKECDGTCPCDNQLNLQNVGGCNHCDPFDWNPVCSTEGNTYRNLCFATCSGDEIKCSSECPC